MALGAVDPWKVWQYGEDDSFATFSARLNKLAASVTAALQNAGIPITTSAADRDARFPAPVKGNTTYRSDLDQVQRYSGAAWVLWGGTGAPTLGASLTLTGGVVTRNAQQVVLGPLLLHATAGIAAGATLVTLPAGYRPAVDGRITFRNEGSGAEGQGYVNAATGVVSVSTAITSGQNITLDGAFNAA